MTLQRPDVDPHDGPVPTDLLVEDLSPGDGAEARQHTDILELPIGGPALFLEGVEHLSREELIESVGILSVTIDGVACATATPGRTVEVHYVGVAHSTGEEFDASWNRGSTFRFPLGAGRVIAGWDRGVAGMKVGGRRRLVIPPHLGYGDRGAGGAIKPGETLIFVVDLVGVH